MATSGSVNTNTYGGRKITLTVEETGTNIENNTSTVKWTLTSGTSSTYHSVYEITAWVNGTADSNKVYGPKTADWSTRAFPCKDGSTSGTVLIQHNADGTANAVPFRLRGSVYTNSPQNYDGSITLTPIPRASSFTISKTSGGSAATSWNLGEALYVNITRASSSFTHKVYFVIGNSGNQVISNSATTSANTTLANSLAQYIPSASGTATIYVDTYSGSTKIGSASKTFTINVPSSVVPSISSVTKSDTAGYLSTYSAYVQGKSNLRVQTSASGNYSTITNCLVKLKNGNTQLTSKTGTDVTFSNISYTGTITVEVTVTDSRNRTATNSSNITVASYSNPTATMTAERRNNDATVTLTWNASIKNINNNNVNSKSFNIYKRQKGTSSWGSAIYSKTDGYTYSSTGSTTSCDADYAWEFKIVAQDSFTSTTYQTEIDTAFELLNWGADGNSMAIGKVASTSNTLDVALATKMTTLDTSGDVNVDGNATIGGKLTIPKDSSKGIYDSSNNPILYTLSNNNGVLNASGGTLFLGYQNTNGVNLVNGKYIITSGRVIYTDTPTNANAQGRFILVPFTSFRQFGTSGTQAYLEALIKWIVTTYPSLSNGVFIGGGEPGSRGSYMLHIYDTNDTDSNGFPKYSSGVWFSLDKSETIRFGTGTYTYTQQVLARTGQIPSVTTGTGTATKTSGNANITAVSYSQYGKTITLSITFNTSGGTTNAGSNAWVGTISGVDLPKQYAGGVGYYSSTMYVGEMDSSGNLTIRVIGVQSASNSNTHRINFTYVCA